MSTSKILSDSKHSLWPECFEIRNQLQKEEQKTTNLWRVNNKLLNPSWAKEEIKGEVNIQIKTKENGNISYQIFDLKSIILKMATMRWLFLKFFFILLHLCQFFLLPFLPPAQPATPQSIPTPSSLSKGHSDMFFDESLPLLAIISILPLLLKLSDCSLYTWFCFCFVCDFLYSLLSF